MSRGRLSSLSTRLKNSLVALLFVGTQVALPLSFSGIASAATKASFDQYGNLVPGWINGNLNANQASLHEGDSVPFRVTITGLTPGSHTLDIAYDNVVNNKHAYDYLTSYDRTFSPNLCDGLGVSATDCASSTTTHPILADPMITQFTPVAGNFSIYNGTISNDTYLTDPGPSLVQSSATTSMRISFTNTDSTVVIGWGGHVASEGDWQLVGSGASSISGSPYHQSILGLDGSGGAQDRSMKASSVILYPHLIISKTVDNSNGGSALPSDFTFTVSPSINNQSTYNVTNDSPADGTGSVTIFNVPGGSYTITESGPAGYAFSSGTGTNCTFATSTATATVAQGTSSTVKNAECDFTNSHQQATLILQKTVVNDNGGTLVASNFPVYIGSTLSSWGSNTVAPGTYTVSETQQTGYQGGSWGGDCSSTGSVTLANGDTKTCTITNNDIPPGLKVVKNVTNDNGGTTQANAFTLRVNNTALTGGTLSNNNLTDTYTYSNPVAGTAYTVSEDSFTGYHQDSITCTDDSSRQSVGNPVTLSLGQNVTCTVVNNDVAPQLTLVKHVTNDNGGTNTADQWTLKAQHSTDPAVINQTGTPSNNGTVATTATAAVSANAAYALSESGPTGYSPSSWQCTGGSLSGDSITLSPGDTVTCTITNDDIAPQLTVTKVVDNNNGGTLDVSSFPLFVGNIQVTSGTTYTSFNAGTYSISETQQPGYTLTGVSGSCLLSNGGISVTLAVGGVYTCTLTNTDIPASITVTKVVHNTHGGTAGVSDFKLYVGNTQVTSGVTNTFAANQQYNVWEQAQVNGYHQDSIVCVDSADQSQANLGATFTPTNGEEVDCTITNSDVAPQLTVIKHVINDNGGTKTAADFTMNVTGTNVSSSSFAGAESPGTTVTLNAGSYSVDEGSHTGYSKTLGQDCSGTIALGETKTCVITNNDSAPSLTLVKHVTNDNGGQRDANEWTLTATGTGATPTNLSGAGGATSGTDFMADTYTLGESGPTDYSQGSWSCTNSVTVNGNDQISLSNGQSTVCTITNDDIAPTLKLVKTVTNDNGGSAKATDWNLSATPSDAQYSTLSGAGGFDFTTARANLQYTLAESTGPSGYAAGSWSCDGGSISGNKITLGLSENVTCTITNNDVAPKLTLVKLVTNNAGSTASATDWTLSATPSDNQYSTLSGAGGFSEQTAQANEAYTLGESGPANFSASDWSCTGGNLSGSQLTLAPGNDVTCYVTNTRDTGTITVNKTIVPSNDSGLFNLTINGLTSYTKTDQSNGGSTGAVPVQTGTYKVSESAGTNTDMSDYSSTWSCNNNTNGPGTTTDSFTVSKGSSIECTFTNTHYAHITVIKNAIPDSSQKFTFHFGIPQIQNIGQLLNVHNSDTSFQLVNDGGNNPNNTWTSDGLAAGTYYVSEDATTGWDFDNVSCSGGSITKDGTKATITVAAGDTVTCTYTNRQRGEIIVHKVTDPSNDTTNFTVTASGTPMINGATAISGNATRTDLSTSHDVIYDVAQGSYSVSESAAPGWIEDDSDCSQLTLNGNTPINNTTGVPTVECTITNTKQATITVTKFNDIDQNGQYDIGKDTLGATETSLPGWQMTLTNGDTLTSSQQTTGNDGSTTFNYVDPGFYSLSETQQNGWQFSNTYCDNTEGGLDGPYYFTVEPGANLNCYVGNYRTSVVLNLSKTNNKPLPTVTGDTVQYTLIVTVPDNSGSTFGTTVTDLPPKGFTYVPGSWTATSTNSDHNVSNDVYNGSLEDGGNGNPTYASPGTWHLGTLIPGETVTLTYLATIGSSVSPGTYPDVAYASGYTTPAYTARVLSNLSTVEDPFVGTQVTIRAGEVLAAQIVVLANTGTSLLAAQFIVPILLIGGIYITRRLSDQKGGRA